MHENGFAEIDEMSLKLHARSRELIPQSSKKERRFFKLEIFCISPNAIPGFNETAIMQTAIITFNHLMEDYLTHAGYRRFRKGLCPKTSGEVQIWLQGYGYRGR